ncbi:flagellar hook-length control protein FliK [Roseburia hominis]|uniref:flagellar hook-length control protein FliK n=1 Tax=Roseburia hominis TaxID=301301 RepID=UPI0020183CE2|nr:flagellar hook-length control protein FliK [Roseburia hominis]MCL3784945.1 flagellar hook-length control protein FliK [Roseburia hominis]
MQISDLVGQYSRNVANGTEELHGAQSVQKLVSTIGDLSAGSIFEGTINSVRGGKVTLALGNGQTITARLDGKMDLQQGSSMFFQVRANDGQTIAIRPYTELGNVSNPILLNALSAAQVPATDRTLVMVDTMMQEQMSIGRQSILDMAKLVGANPDANVQTIVQMTKLGLPVTEEMAAQFENYLSDRQALVGEMDLAAGHMMELLSDEALSPETAFSLYGKMLDIFMPGEEAADAGVTAAAGQESSAAEAGAGAMAEAVGQENAATVSEAEAGAPTAAEQGTAAASAVAEEAGAASTAETAGQGATAEAETEVGVTAELTYGRTAETPGTVGELLSKEQIEHLGKMLRNIPALIGNEEIFAGGEQEEVFVDTLSEEGPEVAKLMAQEEAAQEQPVLNEKLTAEQFLQKLGRALAQNGGFGFAGMQKLFAGKEFQTIFRSVIEKQWLLQPEELKQEHKVSGLYERLEQQLSQMEEAVRATGSTQNTFLQTASQVHGNLEFMNQMNQIYHYVQLPLKMSGQNANGELYVYANRKNLRDPDAELTAFLHLDMEQLGSTDVSVRMQNRSVRTNFYLEDDASYDLVEKHLEVLNKRLKSKGYQSSITVTHEKKDISFKENIVKKGKATVGSLHRYSFDVRA